MLKAAALVLTNPGPLTLWVCCKRHLVKAVCGERPNSYSHNNREGKGALESVVAEPHFYFKYYFVNTLVSLLCSGVLAQSRIPGCWPKPISAPHWAIQLADELPWVDMDGWARW